MESESHKCVNSNPSTQFANMSRPLPSSSKGDSSINSQDLLNAGEKDNLLDAFLLKKRKPCQMGPSSVLNKVKAFLPQMEQANKSLEERLEAGAAEDLDIENVEGCEGPLIEMNFALCPHDMSSDEDGDGEEDSDSSDSSDDGSNTSPLKERNSSQFGEVTPETLKMPGSGKRSKPGRTLIEEVQEKALKVKENNGTS